MLWTNVWSTYLTLLLYLLTWAPGPAPLLSCVNPWPWNPNRSFRTHSKPQNLLLCISPTFHLSLKCLCQTDVHLLIYWSRHARASDTSCSSRAVAAQPLDWDTLSSSSCVYPIPAPPSMPTWQAGSQQMGSRLPLRTSSLLLKHCSGYQNKK